MRRSGRLGLPTRPSCCDRGVVLCASASPAQDEAGTTAYGTLDSAGRRNRSKLQKIDLLSEALANDALHVNPKGSIASLRFDIERMRCSSRNACSARSALAARLESACANLRQTSPESISFALLAVADLVDAFAAAKADSSAGVTEAELNEEGGRLHALAVQCLKSAEVRRDPVGTLLSAGRICRHLPTAHEHVRLDTLLPALRSMYSRGKLSPRQLALLAGGIRSINGASFEQIAPARRLQEALLQSAHEMQPDELCEALALAAEICPRLARQPPGRVAAGLRHAVAQAGLELSDPDMLQALAGAAALSWRPEIVAAWRREGRGYGRDEGKWQRRLAAASVAAALADEWALAAMGLGGEADKGARQRVLVLVRAVPCLKLPMHFGLAKPLAVAMRACEADVEEENVASIAEEVRRQGSPAAAEPVLLAAKDVFCHRGWQLPVSLGGRPPKWRADRGAAKEQERKPTRSWRWGVAEADALARAKPQIELEGFEEISEFSVKAMGNKGQGEVYGVSIASARTHGGEQAVPRLLGDAHNAGIAIRQRNSRVENASIKWKDLRDLMSNRVTSTAGGCPGNGGELVRKARLGQGRHQQGKRGKVRLVKESSAEVREHPSRQWQGERGVVKQPEKWSSEVRENPRRHWQFEHGVVRHPEESNAEMRERPGGSHLLVKSSIKIQEPENDQELLWARESNAFQRPLPAAVCNDVKFVVRTVSSAHSSDKHEGHDQATEGPPHDQPGPHEGDETAMSQGKADQRSFRGFWKTIRDELFRRTAR